MDLEQDVSQGWGVKVNRCKNTCLAGLHSWSLGPGDDVGGGSVRICAEFLLEHSCMHKKSNYMKPYELVFQSKKLEITSTRTSNNNKESTYKNTSNLQESYARAVARTEFSSFSLHSRPPPRLSARFSSTHLRSYSASAPFPLRAVEARRFARLICNTAWCPPPRLPTTVLLLLCTCHTPVCVHVQYVRSRVRVCVLLCALSFFVFVYVRRREGVMDGWEKM